MFLNCLSKQKPIFFRKTFSQKHHGHKIRKTLTLKAKEIVFDCNNIGGTMNKSTDRPAATAAAATAAAAAAAATAGWDTALN